MTEPSNMGRSGSGAPATMYCPYGVAHPVRSGHAISTYKAANGEVALAIQNEYGCERAFMTVDEARALMARIAESIDRDPAALRRMQDDGDHA